MTTAANRLARRRAATKDHGFIRKLVDMMIPDTAQTHQELIKSLDDLGQELRMRPSQNGDLDPPKEH